MSGGPAVNDRGLAYGDGLFETVRVTPAGEAPLWPRHRARLLGGAARLRLPIDPQAVDRCFADTLTAVPGGTGLIKLIVTRGPGGRGYLPPAHPTPSLFAQHGTMPVWSPLLRREGIETGLCSEPLERDPLAGLKHLNRLPQVMARMEVARRGWHEGLLLDRRGCPLEATAMNLFALFGDTLWTPALDGAGVAGVGRDWLLARARQQGRAVQVRLRPLSHLRAADSVFLINSVAGVLPVRKLAQWVWPVTEPVRQFQEDFEVLFS
ncbi:MAG TPA: aminodeoxychorismate lyase [Alcanivorax sp.]|nr:aminodeoxychorismate lyase [Alcanivorax sp.]